ncbi:MAG: hypothetical protein SFX18_04145 [Pirellulales bacterium]|nr:hypothetical protein [Pirellulales bacterium]
MPAKKKWTVSDFSALMAILAVFGGFVWWLYTELYVRTDLVLICMETEDGYPLTSGFLHHESGKKYTADSRGEIWVDRKFMGDPAWFSIESRRIANITELKTGRIVVPISVVEKNISRQSTFPLNLQVEPFKSMQPLDNRPSTVEAKVSS